MKTLFWLGTLILGGTVELVGLWEGFNNLRHLREAALFLIYLFLPLLAAVLVFFIAVWAGKEWMKEDRMLFIGRLIFCQFIFFLILLVLGPVLFIEAETVLSGLKAGTGQVVVLISILAIFRVGLFPALQLRAAFEDEEIEKDC